MPDAEHVPSTIFDYVIEDDSNGGDVMGCLS